MRCRRALAAVLTASSLVVLACGSEPPAMPLICTDTDSAGLLRALHAAPGPVRLRGGVALSKCTKLVLTDADLQVLGTNMHQAAEDLATRAAAGSSVAALQLGYLSAAIDRGSGTTGIAAELARRVQTAVLAAGDAPAVRRALARGAAAGGVNG
ncbi:hypothetical protein [Conexibacter woesei]|uniref:hypothetical protein n=1 Tax=Conexibacter woesei TaxID=191495 RepID=UPI0018C9521A|nr:hypothetical protein [Conexibacter woesei]